MDKNDIRALCLRHALDLANVQRDGATSEKVLDIAGKFEDFVNGPGMTREDERAKVRMIDQLHGALHDISQLLPEVPMDQGEHHYDSPITNQVYAQAKKAQELLNESEDVEIEIGVRRLDESDLDNEDIPEGVRDILRMVLEQSVRGATAKKPDIRQPTDESGNPNFMYGDAVMAAAAPHTFSEKTATGDSNERSGPLTWRSHDKAVSEDELKASATGKRVTAEDLQANIEEAFYFTAADGVTGEFFDKGYRLSIRHPVSLGLLTFCVLVLKNGYVVTGESACADPANYNEEIGRRLARENAERKIWPLMGYALRNELAQGDEA